MIVLNQIECNPKFFQRKYIQFNHLVIDSYDMLRESDLDISFKMETQEYSFTHGGYAPFKKKRILAEAQRLSMTVKINYRKFPKDKRAMFYDWMILNLTTPGKLWAVQGSQLLWANAYVERLHEPYSRERFSYEVDVDLVCYEGVWHKADSRKTFFKPYDPCNYDLCADLREDVDDCIDCCVECQMPKTNTCQVCLCTCDSLNAEDSLCEKRLDVLQDFYERCKNNYEIIYNCEAGHRIWDEKKMLGNKICKEEACDNIIAGRFYSSTVLETDQVTVTLIGSFSNPRLKINNNEMIVKGDYSGKLTINSSCDIYYVEDECCDPVLIEMDKLVIEKGNTLGYTIHQGENSVIVETNNCCDAACVYIKVDPITL